MYNVVKAQDLRPKASTTAVFEGAGHGAGISFFWVNNDPGQGPGLHRHPYSETWLVVSGNATFVVDGIEIEAGADDIVVVDANTPHKFKNSGPDQLRIVCIHASPKFIQEDLEED
ncbi:MAG: cupin domain-containing protein [Actinobacteria bacterium]|nr:cupin domain-containing protein [Actinomycetota bacterium]